MEREAMEAHLMLAGWMPWRFNWELIVINDAEDLVMDLSRATIIGNCMITPVSPFHRRVYAPGEWGDLDDKMLVLACRAVGMGEYDG